jgi:hypothetical protein
MYPKVAQILCSKRYVFLKRDFTSVKLRQGAMFRPKLYCTVHQWSQVDTPSRGTIHLSALKTYIFYNIL